MHVRCTFVEQQLIDHYLFKFLNFNFINKFYRLSPVTFILVDTHHFNLIDDDSDIV